MALMISLVNMRPTRRRNRKRRQNPLSDLSSYASKLDSVCELVAKLIMRDQRGMTQEKAAAEAEARLKAEEELQAQRKADSKDLAGETIRRELAESG